MGQAGWRAKARAVELGYFRVPLPPSSTSTSQFYFHNFNRDSKWAHIRNSGAVFEVIGSHLKCGVVFETTGSQSEQWGGLETAGSRSKQWGRV
jgi:hypothetical protein